MNVNGNKDYFYVEWGRSLKEKVNQFFDLFKSKTEGLSNSGIESSKDFSANPIKLERPTVEKVENARASIHYSYDFIEEESDGEGKPLLSDHHIEYERNSDKDEKNITIEFIPEKFKNKNFGKDVIDRVDTLEELKMILDKRINQFNRQELELNGQELEKINRQKIIAEEHLLIVEQKLKEGSTWLEATAFRTLLNAENQSYKTKVEQMLSAPINMRVQAYVSPSTTLPERFPFVRLGVIHDQRNNWTNLRQMKDMLTDRDLRVKKRKEIEKEAAHSKEPGQIESACYAINQLSEGKLLEAIQDRRVFLQDQFLQLLMKQVEEHETSLKTGNSTLDLIHFSLLNPSKDEVSKNGWVHKELNQIMDMYEIFREFDDKKIIFDGGPFVDKNGDIHLPKVEGYPDEVKLNTVYLNVSVQGKVTRAGRKAQLDINREGLGKLQKMMTQPEIKEADRTLFEEAKASLEKGKSNYFVAEEIALSAVREKKPVSIGCMSGKDRTGFVAARIVVRLAEQEVDKDHSLTKQQRKSIKQEFARKIIDPNFGAALVIAENFRISERIAEREMDKITNPSLEKRIIAENSENDEEIDIRVLKVSPMNLPGFQSIRNRFARIAYYVDQAKLALFKK